MTLLPASNADMPKKNPFLMGVFLIAFAVLQFQIVQTRILSVVTWYYLAFFAISVAMLGMTAGAVWVYLRRSRLPQEKLFALLTDTALLCAVTMPVSVMVQFSLITKFVPAVTSMFSWTLMISAMTLPYFFAGITVSLALNRSPFAVGLVYGIDLLGAALGCAAVVAVLNIMDGPSAIFLAGLIASLAACAFVRSAPESAQILLNQRSFWHRPLTVSVCLALLIPFNMLFSHGLKPLMVKDTFEQSFTKRFEKWNSYSRIVAYPPVSKVPVLWGASPLLNKNLKVQQASLNIDGMAGTFMHHFDGTTESIDFLRYDLVNIAYYLPGIKKSAVIGVGGGRDLMAAYLFGVKDITGIELNPIFIHLLTRDSFYAPYSNLEAIPGLKLHVDDARSWFASTNETFDLIQMSMIDTWAATGAGAFSLSENGLYTLQGWRAFINRLSDNGVFTVSRWYSPGDINESGRMVALAMAAMIDRGVESPRQHIFVAHADTIATLVLSKSPFTQAALNQLHQKSEHLGFKVLVSPDMEPESGILQQIVAAQDIPGINRVSSNTILDLSVPTDNSPFFFNQLRFRNIPHYLKMGSKGQLNGGVIGGNLRATITLIVILVIAFVAVLLTIILPLRTTAKSSSRSLVLIGTIYFSLIGTGFMFAEISLLQYFGIFLGHPIYAMSVCLFSLILSSGLGSIASASFSLHNNFRIALWGTTVAGYFLLAQWGLTDLFEMATEQPLPVRMLVSLLIVMPVGFLMGFAFPTGMSLVEGIDAEPKPWFWGINGATGVFASVLAVMLSMAFGINVTMFLAGLCYLALIPAGWALLSLSRP